MACVTPLPSRYHARVVTHSGASSSLQIHSSMGRPALFSKMPASRFTALLLYAQAEPGAISSSAASASATTSGAG